MGFQKGLEVSQVLSNLRMKLITSYITQAYPSMGIYPISRHNRTLIKIKKKTRSLNIFKETDGSILIEVTPLNIYFAARTGALPQQIRLPDLADPNFFPTLDSLIVEFLPRL